MASRPALELRDDGAHPLYRELIERWLRDGRTMMSIWQELVDRHGFTARYAAVQRFVRGFREELLPEARVVIATRPGEESQVDYGDGPVVRHPVSGTYRRTRLFVLTLAHSRKAVRLVTWKSSSKIWAQLHERAFRRLGGVTATVVIDNLKEGVITPDVHDPLLIRSTAMCSRTTAQSRFRAVSDIRT